MTETASDNPRGTNQRMLNPQHKWGTTFGTDGHLATCACGFVQSAENADQAERIARRHFDTAFAASKCINRPPGRWEPGYCMIDYSVIACRCEDVSQTETTAALTHQLVIRAEHLILLHRHGDAAHSNGDCSCGLGSLTPQTNFPLELQVERAQAVGIIVCLLMASGRAPERSPDAAALKRLAADANNAWTTMYEAATRPKAAAAHL